MSKQTATKPLATISVDLDNAWAYRRAAGHDDWQRTESFLPLAIERMVSTLTSLKLPLTVFLVGRDLQSPRDVDAMRRFEDLCHWEPANHSWNHLPWLHTMPPDQIDDEIATTQAAIEDIFRIRPYGFRGPGFSCPDEVLRVLKRRGYRYDASLFPTSLAPLARLVFLLRSELRGPEREKAKQLYGGWASMRLPNQPHVRQFDAVMDEESSANAGCKTSFQLDEIPVTTMPLLRTPIHLTYVNFLATYSSSLAKLYFRTALRLCHWTGTRPSLLLHPPDFLGREDVGVLRDFPGMKMSAGAKQSMTRWVLEQLVEQFDVRTMIGTLPSIESQNLNDDSSQESKSHDRSNRNTSTKMTMERAL